jgi:hypothetical protein
LDIKVNVNITINITVNITVNINANVKQIPGENIEQEVESIPFLVGSLKVSIKT